MPAVQSAHMRQKVRSLSLLLLILAGMGSIGSLFAKSSIVLVVSSVLLIISYGLTRTRFYRAGGLIAIATLSAVPFASLVIGENYDQDRIVAIFIWLILPILLSSFVFSLRGILMLIAGYAGAIAALPVFIPEMTFLQIANMLALIGAVAGFTFLITRTREINIRELVISEQREQAAREIRASEEKYYNLFNFANDAIFLIDPETLKFIDVNEVATERLGYTRAEFLQMGINEIYSPDDSVRNREIIDQIKVEGNVVFENTHIRKDGTPILVEVSSRVVEFGGRQVFQSIARNIRDRKLSEEKLRQYSDRFATLHQIESAMLAAESPEEISRVALTRLREVVRCNHTSIFFHDHVAQEVLVYGVDEDTGEDSSGSLGIRYSFSDVQIPEALYDGTIHIENDISSISNPSRMEHALSSKDINCFVSIPLMVQGELWGSLNLGGPLKTKTFSAQNIAVAQEVSSLVSVALQQATLFREVKLGRARLQALSRRLVEAQEAERHHIANELHDEIGQALTGINLALETHICSLDDDQGYAPLREAQKMAEELVVLVQRMSLDLRPAMLDDLGLLPTLMWHFDRYQGQTGIKVLFDSQNLEGRYSRAIETASYRILQEALTNVARHANVKEVQVRTSLHEGVLLIFIEDRGEGFSLETAMASGYASGLVGMRERALSLGGD
ncbi:MAG: PAS domain S-box protein, partial [Chloroflexi bacterium]|nr:PAS domain S-box protein [Chloroflexota bacterium]